MVFSWLIGSPRRDRAGVGRPRRGEATLSFNQVGKSL
jgi:hypothetical protein